jgi:branched-chain amino acid transport system ATP-binding protein
VTAQAGTLLAVEGVGMRFGGVAALDDVSFCARSGEVLGIMGPNGAGKTTLFNVISGVQSPTSGSVRFGGTPVTGLSPNRIATLGLTRTFQTPVMFWGLSVRESIAVALQARAARGSYPATLGRSLLPSGAGFPARRKADEDTLARADALIAGTRLAPLADRATESLSFGEERLLELARARALEPRALLLDEPLSGLDQGEAAQVLEEVRAARTAGVTVLLVEHAVDELLAIADRIVVLDHGKKIAEGSRAEVVANPLVVDAYLGDEFA